VIHPIALLKRAFGWGSKGTEPAVEAEEPYAVVLLAYDYDELTTRTSQWIQDLRLPTSLKGSDVHRIVDPNMGKAELQQVLNNINPTRRVEVFCGHGDYDALLGPAQGLATDVSIGDTSHSVVYDGEMISHSRGAMFAFCCRAGYRFGRVFGAIDGKSFLGFRDDLPFEVEDYFVGPVKRIFQSVAQEVISVARVLPEHERLLHELYDHAMSQILAEEKCEHRFLARLYLAEHKSQIARFGDSL
jgi:hypothetical protein